MFKSVPAGTENIGSGASLLLRPLQDFVCLVFELSVIKIGATNSYKNCGKCCKNY